MYTSFLPIVSLLFTLAAASASPASSSTVCAANGVFQSCLGTTNGAITAYCTDPTDYACLCTRWEAVENCYKLCPNDPGLAAATSSRQTYCANASIYGTKSATAVSAPASTASSSAATTSTANTDATTSTSSSTSAAAAATSNAAVRQAAGAIVVLAGGLVALL